MRPESKVQSDLFMELAKEISVGSLSPTINWRTLAEQEFVLPPQEEQRRIAAVLASILALDEQLRTALIAAGVLRNAAIEELFDAVVE